MSQNYQVKTIVTSSGERLPILLGRDGLPMFEATVFSLSEVRARNRASNTIDSYLRSVMVFLLFLDLREINLEDRLRIGQLLSLGEVEELVGICRLPLESIHLLINKNKALKLHNQSSVSSLEKFRRRGLDQLDTQVDGNTASNRLRNIRDYLKWLVLNRISKHGINAKLRASLESSIQHTSQAVDARLPSGSFRHSVMDQREGLEPEVVNQILKIVDPQSKQNPWLDDHSKYRNELIVLWLLNLGVRRGELLNIRIDDLNFRDETVMVLRRPDSPNDPRKNQPKVKTRGREIPLSTGLVDKTNAYIMNYRSQIKGARKHDFLFVASDTGAPLSISALNKIFNVLNQKNPYLKSRVFPHIFRHTWNDRFSEVMDKNNISEIEENKLRSNMMGWEETSGTAATYTRRHIRKKAKEVSLQTQTSMLGTVKDE